MSPNSGTRRLEARCGSKEYGEIHSQLPAAMEAITSVVQSLKTLSLEEFKFLVQWIMNDHGLTFEMEQSPSVLPHPFCTILRENGQVQFMICKDLHQNMIDTYKFVFYFQEKQDGQKGYIPAEILVALLQVFAGGSADLERMEEIRARLKAMCNGTQKAEDLIREKLNRKQSTRRLEVRIRLQKLLMKNSGEDETFAEIRMQEQIMQINLSEEQIFAQGIRAILRKELKRIASQGFRSPETITQSFQSALRNFGIDAHVTNFVHPMKGPFEEISEGGWTVYARVTEVSAKDDPNPKFSVVYSAQRNG